MSKDAAQNKKKPEPLDETFGFILGLRQDLKSAGPHFEDNTSCQKI